MTINALGHLPASLVARSIGEFGSPLYLYDEQAIRQRCRDVISMPNAFGLDVHYAMKANSTRAILQVIADEGIGIDASSTNEVRRAHLANVPSSRIMLTSQQVPEGQDRSDLETWIAEGLTYNVCSLRQLDLIVELAAKRRLGLSVRVNPGVGTGESATRNTGDKYSSFGIHHGALEELVERLQRHSLQVNQVHVHIGSGGDPKTWCDNIDRMLTLLERFFVDATKLNLGGGFKVARMPNERAADLPSLGSYAADRFRDFRKRTGRDLRMAVEPGTFLVANAGYLLTTVTDKKSSGPDGFQFLVLDAGMESHTRPLLYGARHPFFVVSRDGRLLSSEFDPEIGEFPGKVVVGRCCETGDCQTLDAANNVTPRPMADPEIGDHVVIGAVGAYGSSMTLVNYNSYVRPPEVLLRSDGSLFLIRRRQNFSQLVADELALDQRH